MIAHDVSGELASRVIETNSYFTLATADASGRPWATPVWFAARDRDEFFWVSRPGAQHSRNIAVRSAVGIAIFDSTVEPGRAEAAYIEAVALEVDAEDRAAALGVYNGKSEQRGLALWQETDVAAPAEFRLYRARAKRVWVLDEHDQRVLVE